MIAVAHHPVAVTAPRSLVQGDAPYLLQRDDADFVAAVLAELGSAGGRSRLAATRAAARTEPEGTGRRRRGARREGGTLKLYAPMQRRFHVALVEAWCDTPGRPRIDPARVEASGMVLRRVRPGGGYEGWMKAEGAVRGWLPVERMGEEGADPDPAVRVARRATGVPSVDRALRVLGSARDASVLAEDVTPMFVAPPDLCAGEGHTFYYGVVPTASSELADAAPDVDAAFEDFGPDSDAFKQHLVGPLRGLAFTFPTPNLSGRRFNAAWLRELSAAASNTTRAQLLLLLRQVAVEFDAFGTSAPSRALRRRLDDVTLEYALATGETRRRTVRASDFLEEAVGVLLNGEAGTVEMPDRWPSLSATEATALAAAMSGSMRERFKAVKGRPGRFDDADAHYVLRAFVRLEPEGRCPSRTVWSAYTEPFVIAPWWEVTGDPVQIALPDLTDKNRLKKLKPNVAFTLPPGLQRMADGDPTKFLEGSDGRGPDLGIGWICSFSIPVITFCAFIVLSIFLSLFNLFFQWMLFIKICIPYPKAAE